MNNLVHELPLKGFPDYLSVSSNNEHLVVSYYNGNYNGKPDSGVIYIYIYIYIYNIQSTTTLDNTTFQHKQTIGGPSEYDRYGVE